MWHVPHVRRHRVVPPLELPHHRGIASVPVLQERIELRVRAVNLRPLGLIPEERKTLRKLLRRVLDGLLRVPAESHSQA
jgi:hypothetical protein